MIFILHSLINVIYTALKTLKALEYIFLLIFYENKDMGPIYHQRKMLKLSPQGCGA